MGNGSPSDRIEYRCAEPRELPQLATLKSKVYRGASQENWSRRWAWQFVEHPRRKQEHASNFLVGLLDGVIIGGIGWIPTRIVHRGTESEAAFGCDLFLDPDAQGHGLGKTLIARVVELFPVSLWMNCGTAGAKHYESRGFTPVVPVNYQALIAHPGMVLRMMGRTRLGRALDWAEAPARSIVRQWARWVKPPAGVRISESRTASLQHDLPLLGSDSPTLAHPLRDMPFLKWRYQTTPLGPYRIRTALSGSAPVGFVIYRKRETHGETVGIVNELRVATGTGGLGASLLAAAAVELLSENVSAVRILATDPDTLRDCRRLGMIDIRRTPYLYISPGSAERLQLPTVGSGWNLSYGDCDLDIG